MIEVVVLFLFAFAWIIFAVFEDLKNREIANWLNYSLVIFVLVFRFFYSLFEMNDFSFFYNGVLGYLIFFILGNLFYYGNMFAGGDAKLFMSLGAVLPISTNFFYNLELLLIFVCLFLIVGAVYGLIISLFFGMKYFSKLKLECKKQFILNKKIVFFSTLFSILFLILGFKHYLFLYFGLLIFILPYLYIYVKSVDESCMVKKVKPSKLTEGDWLYKDVKVGNKIIRATWDGLNEKDIKLLKKKKFVLVRYGVQFAPVFLISFILFCLMYFFDLFELFILFIE